MPVKRNNPLLQYHPVRFYEVRKDFITELINIILPACKENVNLAFSVPEDIKAQAYFSLTNSFVRQIYLSVSNELFPTYLREMSNLGKNYYLTKNYLGLEAIKDFFDLLTNDDYLAFEQYTSFNVCGSNIFEFSQELLEFFLHTDVDKVLLRDIRLPFNTIYLHFGRQEDKRINGNISFTIQSLQLEDPSKKFEDICFLLDGAYVNQCPDTGSLKITLTSVKNKITKYTNNCVDYYEDTLSFYLEADSINSTIQDAASKERQRLLESNKIQIQRQIDEGVFTQSTYNEAKLNKSIDDIINYLKLVINCALYLQSYPDDIEEDYTTEAPRNLVQQTKRAPGAAAAATKKLNQLGYRKIKFCGSKRQQFWQLEDEEVSEPVLVGAVSLESKRNMAPHKRRAHIRKQRYGKELQSWRYVWIKETTVHKDKYNLAPQQYRIYEVAD
ncbi:hypothetical protein NIES4071_107520 (plasmid) [Calothrix sp. NIES-4071]|nr:hypothetical protein NIES4071_107520 [Calothrix sp. NIES-4071]BAZ64792.1 hypothetical protein NIES4105_105250 [Calothrix sp. NIES-4105]